MENPMSSRLPEVGNTSGALRRDIQLVSRCAFGISGCPFVCWSFVHLHKLNLISILCLEGKSTHSKDQVCISKFTHQLEILRFPARHGGPPRAGWFISWKIPSINGWFGAPPFQETSTCHDLFCGWPSPGISQGDFSCEPVALWLRWGLVSEMAWCPNGRNGTLNGMRMMMMMMMVVMMMMMMLAVVVVVMMMLHQRIFGYLFFQTKRCEGEWSGPLSFRGLHTRYKECLMGTCWPLPGTFTDT